MGKVIKETIHANGIDIGIYTQDFENEGREKERMKNICSMLALSLSPEIIAKACEVSVDYVLNLKKELER